MEVRKGQTDVTYVMRIQKENLLKSNTSPRVLCIFNDP